VLLGALDILQRNDRLPDHVRVVIAGDAQGREFYVRELNDAIARGDLHGVAQLAGHVEDMAAAYCAADIVVSASTDPEAFGRVPPEAAAMGRPVIATDHGGARETVLPGQSGLLVIPGNRTALADAIADLLARPREELAQMGTRGRAHIARNYTVERMCEQTLAVYRELLALKP
jgi:glycosyltransferase involved in cell wall biosynthesis